MQEKTKKTGKTTRVLKIIGSIYAVFGFIISLPYIYNGAAWLIDSGKQFVNNPDIATITRSLENFNKSETRSSTFSTDCSNLVDQWQPGKNIYFDVDNKIKLKDDNIAGAIFLKDSVSTFLTFEIKFRSSLVTGINTNISLKNDDGELKYAIGDGDFETIRYSYIPHTGEIHKERSILSSEIDNGEEIGFKINIVETGGINKVISSLVYKDILKKDVVYNLEDLIIKNPQKIFLTVGFGLDARKEINNKDAYIEILSCNITEASPSKILDQ